MTKSFVFAAFAGLIWVSLTAQVSAAYIRPSVYSVETVLTLPYGDIVQTITDYYDASSPHDEKQTLDYFHGTDIYIYRPGKKVTWQVNPVITKQKCYTTPGEVSLTPLIPDISQTFHKQNATVFIRGKECFDYVYITQNEQKVNTYHFYTTVQDETPMQFHFLGYNTVTGSHYDEYIFDYYSYQSGSASFPANIFEKPDMECESWSSESLFGSWDPRTFLGRLVHVSKASGDATDTVFEQFLRKFNKNYASASERAEREKVFLQNLQFIHSKNHEFASQGLSARLEVNRFTDMTHSERALYTGAGRRRRRNRHGGLRKSGAMSHSAVEEPLTELPTHVDWRTKGAVNPVKDQGPCGSCWSFGTTGTIEGHYFLKYGVLPVLSQQELVDCSWKYENNGCDGGLDTSAYEWIMSNGGLSTQQAYGPYLAANGWCGVNRTVTKPLVQLSSYVNVKSGDERALMAAIALQGPTSISIDASLDSFSFYSSGVYYDPKCKNGYNDLDHTVLAVGYGTTENGEDYWIVKNSWSTYWGDDGYILMSRKGNNCGVATDATYPILK
eukprot:gb/GECG01013855.1/.p1 GENE.gb/GECG01013855.1/~~gb/GECG01013855.1/.p1  ORF type:complete len:556 (+),score=48.28 gb/GECG01013855.1/:1-1668(+)